MNFTLPFFSLALPELVLLCCGLFILLVDAFFPKAKTLVYVLVQFSLLATFLATLPQFQEYNAPLVTFSGHYVVDKLAVIAKLVIYLFSMLAFAYTRDFFSSVKNFRNEYFILGLFAVLGMSIMASAYSLLTVYLGLELLSLVLYALVAMHKDSDFAIEAAMKYFVLGSFASGLMLYGISLFYGLTGSIGLDSLSHALQTQNNLMMVLALIFVLGGLLFKFGAVPFHMWVPDVYQGAAAPTTLFIASAPKVAAFVVTIRVLVQALPSMQSVWMDLLTVAAVLSMFFGNVIAIAQTNLKRMLAYSSIAHIGYTLLGIIAGPNSSQGYSAAMFYISTYVLVAAGAFAVIGILSRQGVEFDQLDDYRGLNARSPWLAFMMLLLLFSMAGVPPTVGFFAKLGLLEALVQANHVPLAVAALVFALIGAYYYLRVVMLMYFEEPTPAMAAVPITMSKEALAAISVNGAAALVLGVLPSFAIDLCRISVG